MQRVTLSPYQTPLHKLGDTQIRFSPIFRVRAAVAATESWGGDVTSLIPGLPDDLGLSCLLRVPVESHPACRIVCRRWSLLFKTKERFFSQRRLLGYRSPWLFVFAFHDLSRRMQGHVLDLTNLSSWHDIPAMPCKERVNYPGFRCVANPREPSTLIVIGGGMVSDVDSEQPTSMVFEFEMHRNRWRTMNPMQTGRSSFAAGAIDGFIYVAGGNTSDFDELDSAEVLDPGFEKWCPVAHMVTKMASFDAAVLDGKLFVAEGWTWPFVFFPRGEVYNPKSNMWEIMATGLREGWTGPSAVVYGHLFVVPEHEEKTKLKVYFTELDSWEAVEGPPLPEQIMKPFSVIAYDYSKICIVGHNLHVAIGKMERQVGFPPKSESKHHWSFSVKWEVIEAPESLRGLNPSGSQVLYA